MNSLTLKQKFNAFKGMTIRNIKIYFKDKGTVFFSMLAPIIILGLYILFLRDTYLEGIKESFEGVKHLLHEGDVDNIANTWLLAGILSTCTITVSLNSLSVMVGDKDRKVDYDYNSSPCYGAPVVLSYFVGAFVNTLLVSLLALTIGLVAITIVGNSYLSFVSILELVLITIIACASSTMIMMIIASFFKKPSALGAFGGIVSAAVGFIVGAYIPLGSFGKVAQTIMSLLPGSQIASLYRSVLMTGVIDNVSSVLGDGASQMSKELNDVFSLSLNMFDYQTTKLFSYLYSLGSVIVALVINILIYKKASKRA